MTFFQVLDDYLSGRISVEDFLLWVETGESEPETLKESFGKPHLEALRLELPLNLLNFLRDETESILTASQACGQTPLKAQNPSKYDFTSPIKASDNGKKTEKRSKRGNLFGGENDNSIVKKIEASSDPKIQSLTERFSDVQTPNNLKLNGTKNNARRSLDSFMNKTPKTPVGSTFADYFDVKSIKSKKKKNRKSDPIVSEKPTQTIQVRRSPEKLAKMTPEKKQEFDKSEIWQKITEGIDKTPKTPKVVEAKPVPKLSSPLKSLLSVKDSISDFLDPELEEVTNGEKLDKLAQLYNLCIHLHLVPNILVELYSTFQILTVKDSKSLFEQRSKSGLLHSVHNCVYFAAKVLESQGELLEHLDRATLVFLVENPRLEVFCPDFKTELEKILSFKKIRHNSSNGNNESFSNSVRFQSETDSRETFPDAQTFQDFKKQRDMFYEMLRNWRSLKENFSTSVIKILTTQEHPTNLQHFSKLFQDQLLSLCLSEAYDNDQQEIDEANLEADLKHLSEFKKKMPAAKWSSLQARFFMRSQFGGPSPEPNFSGCQEFFKDFIAASNYAFVQHLKNVLAKSILELNETEFNLEKSRSEISKAILSLRILAKFLAFIEILPYSKCGSNLNQTLINGLLEAKINHLPCLDLKNLILKAKQKQRLVVTLPWVIEFCSILDPISAKSDYFQQVFKILIQIYKVELGPKQSVISETSEVSDLESDLLTPNKKVQELKKSDKKLINQFNAFFLSIHLGWLFENSNFPRELFIEDPLKEDDLDLKTSQNSIDVCKSLKLNLLYNCCPYVSELKVILSQFHTGFKASKVIPTKTPKEIKLNNAGIKPEDMQSALEANFFHNQPASVKNTVDIVTDRITSNFVRILTLELIPKDSKEVMTQISENIKACETSDESIKKDLICQVEEMAGKSHSKIKQSANQIIQDQLARKVDPALSCLLPDDTKETVINFCAKIIEKRIKKNARKWMQTNMAKNYFHKVYEKEFNKLWADHIKSLSTCPQGKQWAVISVEQINYENVIPVSQILIKLKADTCKMMEGKQILSMNLHNFLDQIEASFASAFLEASPEDKSILEVNVKGFETLSFDWLLALVTFQPNLLKPEIQERILSIWGGTFSNQSRNILFRLTQPPTPLATLLSVRNLGVFDKSPNPKATWDKLEHLIGRLLKSGLLLPIGLEDQILPLLKKDWPENLLKRLGSCLQGVIDSWKKEGIPRSQEELKNFTPEFLDWFAWFLMNNEENGLEDSLENFPELGL